MAWGPMNLQVNYASCVFLTELLGQERGAGMSELIMCCMEPLG